LFFFFFFGATLFEIAFFSELADFLDR